MNETSVYVAQYGTFFALFNELGIDAMRCVYTDFELHILIHAIRIYRFYIFTFSQPTCQTCLIVIILYALIHSNDIRWANRCSYAVPRSV